MHGRKSPNDKEGHRVYAINFEGMMRGTFMGVDNRQLELAWQMHLGDHGEMRSNRLLADIADERGITPSYLHPGLCLTALPVRSLRDAAAMWRVDNGQVASLIVRPERDNEGRFYGVPSGTMARFILLYLMDQAIRFRSPQIELGRSMSEWLSRMGVGNGGKNYLDVKRQLQRIRHCRMSLELRSTANNKQLTTDRAIIASDVSTIGTAGRCDHEMLLIELSRDFYEEVLRHPVVVQEAAIRRLGPHCRALDVYLWLSFRLPYLQGEEGVRVSWPALHAQFGAEVRQLKHFKKAFVGDFDLAVRAYPGARVLLTEQGAHLLPSPSPLRAALA